jgi:hypothetical protein
MVVAMNIVLGMWRLIGDWSKSLVFPIMICYPTHISQEKHLHQAVVVSTGDRLMRIFVRAGDDVRNLHGSLIERQERRADSSKLKVTTFRIHYMLRILSG